MPHAHLRLGLTVALAAAWSPSFPRAQGTEEPPSLALRIDSMLERARPSINGHLKSAEGGRLALICLAALHEGFDPNAAPLRDALGRLASTERLETYGLALRLMVFGHVYEHRERERLIAEDTKGLLTHQAVSGYFGYNNRPEPGDLSNTQYAALGLRVAVKYGGEVEREAVGELLEGVLAAQEPDGAFSYRPNGELAATVSMTVGAIVVLELGAQMAELAPEQHVRARTAIERAWGWVARHPDDIGNSKVANCLYMHWGLERAAILSGREKLGDVDWYSRGANMLQSIELSRGGFSVGRGSTRLAGVSSLTDTAFGVLFLRRKFQRTLRGPITGAATNLCHTLPADATGGQIESAIKLDVNRGFDAVPNLLEALKVGTFTQRFAAVRALREISGRNFNYDPEIDSRLNAAALRRAERWWLRVQKSQRGR